MSENTDAVTELTAASTGRWLVTTSGSEHIFDLDYRTYTRLPGVGRGQFVGDCEPMRLYAVRVYPKVGTSFYVELDDPDDQLSVLWRLSSTVVSIERMDDGE